MRQPSFDNLEKVLAARARRSKLQVGSSPGRLQEVETLMREQDAAGAQRLAARACVDAAASAFELVSELEAAEVRVDAAASGFSAYKKALQIVQEFQLDDHVVRGVDERRAGWARAAAASARRAADAADDEEGPRSSPPRPWARSAAADEAELRAKLGGVAQRALVTNRAEQLAAARVWAHQTGDGRRRRPQRARAAAPSSPPARRAARKMRVASGSLHSPTAAAIERMAKRANRKLRIDSDVREVAANLLQRVARGAQGRSRARERRAEVAALRAAADAHAAAAAAAHAVDRLPPSEHWLESWDKRKPAQRREEWLPAWPEGSWPKYGWP